MQQVMILLTMFLSPLRSRLYINTAYLSLAVVTLALLGFAFWTMVARIYPPEVIGLGGSAINSIMVLAQVSQLGLGYVLIRLVPQGGKESVTLLARSLTGVTLSSLLSTFIFLAALPLWSEELRHLLWKDAIHLGGFAFLAVIITIAGLFRFIFIAYRRGLFVLVFNLCIGLLRFPLVILFAGLGSAFSIVAAHGLAVLVSILIAALWFLPKCTGVRFPPLALDIWKLRTVVPFATINLASHMLTMLVWQLLPLLVISLAGAEAAGFFYVGWTVAGVVLIMTQQLSLSLFAEGSYDIRSFGPQVWKSLLLGVALAGLFAVALYIVADLILLSFGSQYLEHSAGVLKVLAAATPLAAVTHIYLGMERVHQRMVPLVAVSAAVAAVTVGVTIELVPRLGIVGAGHGVLAGYGVGALLSVVILYLTAKGGHRFMKSSHSNVV